MPFVFADPKQLWLEISPETQTAARRISRQVLAPGAQWQVYLNWLCMQTFLSWAREEIDSAATAFPATNPIPTCWEMVTGSCLTVNNTKLALLPADAVGQDELLVPQEWLDLPSWAADYYLAVKVNPDEGWIEGWGYASYRQLREDAIYDTWARSYSLDGVELETDISELWTTIERYSPEAIQAKTLSETSAEKVEIAALSSAQAENLITRLANSDLSFPRLSIPFAQWGALLSDERWRRQLWERRLAIARGGVGVALSQVLQGVEGAIANSLPGSIADGWQSIEAVFGAQAQQLAFGFRQGEQAEGRQAKEIRFNDEQIIRLALLWQLEADGRLAIRAQLYPAEGELYLPTGLTLSLFSDQGERLQSIQSGDENNYIQLKRFKCPSGYAFYIEIQLRNQRITERFVS